MKKLPNHWENKHTYIFKLPDGRFLIKNGCQVFYLEDLDRVCDLYKVPADVRQLVRDNLPVYTTHRLPRSFKDPTYVVRFFEKLPIDLALRWYYQYFEYWPDVILFNVQENLARRIPDPKEAYAHFGDSIHASVRKIVCSKFERDDQLRLYRKDPAWEVRSFVASGFPLKTALRLFGRDPNINVIVNLAYRMTTDNSEKMKAFAKHRNPEVRLWLLRKTKAVDAFEFFRDDPVEKVQLEVLKQQTHRENCVYFTHSKFSEVQAAARRRLEQHFRPSFLDTAPEQDPINQ